MTNTTPKTTYPIMIDAITTPLEDSSIDGITYCNVPISFRSRVIVALMRLIAKPMLARMSRATPDKLGKIQLRVASLVWPDIEDMPIRYDIVGNVPGHVFGDISQTSKPLVLWLHGGAFFLPAAPNAHLSMAARLCKAIGAVGFMPDYRLAPLNPFPRGLNDCEAAYQAVLNAGFAPSRIVLGGDSAGGNLLFGLLQRLRNNSLPMPACAIPVSPATELGRIHGPSSRHQLVKRDPLLPLAALVNVTAMYCGEHDSADPEISPLYMDCQDLPPMFFLCSSNEILMDESVLLARRCQAAGVDTTCHVWPVLPHAFPLFADVFPEARQACEDIAAFARQHLAGQ
ncbi:alpha/beta hydrolase [Litorivivens sp.]|uniref:alpha/beta hydrolase n=1 Tax=Litorivivens sp. TaxID=2020868 RepID=UPI00356A041E